MPEPSGQAIVPEEDEDVEEEARRIARERDVRRLTKVPESFVLDNRPDARKSLMMS